MSVRSTLARVTVAGMAATLGVAGLVGYAAADATTPAAATAPELRAAPAGVASATAKTAGIRLSGALDERGALSRAELKKFKQRSVKSVYLTKSGTQRHTYTGALLLDVLKAAEPAFTSDKHDPLRFAILVTAADGFQAVLAWGEIDKELANKKVLIALTEDGKTLARPRLVVPGDSHGARQVYDVERVTLLRLSQALAGGSAGHSTGSGIHLGDH